MSLNISYHYKKHESCLGEWEKNKIINDLLEGHYKDIIKQTFTTREEAVAFASTADIWFDKHGNLSSYNGHSY